VLSEPGPECRWHGRTGFVHEAVLEDWAELATFQVYVSGAPAMVEAARRDFTTCAGLPACEFLSDSFVSEADRAADPLLGVKYA
jgi:CDP-4-dehydro-6-deoxyglucose reductase